VKVTFVLPAIGKKPGERYIGTWKMEPLTIAVLAALTPPDVETVLVDDRVELVDADAPTDLVAITVETYTARRAYELADRFRARGVPVVLGGYHVTLLPAEAAAHADAIVTGNAEAVWADVVADARARRLRPRYDGGVGFAAARPDRRLYAGKPYLPVGLVETGRGCGHACEFCAIAGYYGARYHPRPVDDIVADVEASGRRMFFLVDDNLVADRAHLLELCRRLKPLGVLWAAQGTITMANDPALLTALKDAGCELVLIGFESLEDESLRAMGKRWSSAAGDRAELVRRIHDAGIGIYATFVLGYDGDTRETFERTLDGRVQPPAALPRDAPLRPARARGTPAVRALVARPRLPLRTPRVPPGPPRARGGQRPVPAGPQGLRRTGRRRATRARRPAARPPAHVAGVLGDEPAARPRGRREVRRAAREEPR